MCARRHMCPQESFDEYALLHLYDCPEDMMAYKSTWAPSTMTFSSQPSPSILLTIIIISFIPNHTAECVRVFACREPHLSSLHFETAYDPAERHWVHLHDHFLHGHDDIWKKAQIGQGTTQDPWITTLTGTPDRAVTYRRRL